MAHADLSVNITLENEAGPVLRRTAGDLLLARAGATLRRWMSEERTDGPAAFAPNAIVAFGPDLAERFETTPYAEAPPELIEAARTITAFEDEAAPAARCVEQPCAEAPTRVHVYVDGRGDERHEGTCAAHGRQRVTVFGGALVPVGSRPPCIPDHGLAVWCAGCAWDGEQDDAGAPPTHKAQTDDGGGEGQ